MSAGTTIRILPPGCSYLSTETAEKIMGWDHVPFYEEHGSGWHMQAFNTWRQAGNHKQIGKMGWSPDTELDDAFRLVKAMQGKGFLFDLSDHVDGWRARFNRSDAIAHTAPEAICRAALAAIGGPS